MFRAVSALGDHQVLGRATRAAHAAAFCDVDGTIVMVREDVGRHNAFDKLIGALAHAGIDPATGFVVLTARCSFELVQKAVIANVPVLATISAASTMAVDQAHGAWPHVVQPGARGQPASKSDSGRPMSGFADTPALSPRARFGVLVAIAALHILLGIALMRAFGGVRALADQVGLGPVLVAMAPPAAPPPPSNSVRRTRARRGRRRGGQARQRRPDRCASAAFADPHTPRRGRSPGRAATPGRARARVAKAPAVPARAAGTGSGGAGNGSGGRYARTKPVKIAGDLAESDYPKAGRAKRLGTTVIVILTVGADGRVSDCDVHQPSGDPEADAVTCKLAT